MYNLNLDFYFIMSNYFSSISLNTAKEKNIELFNKINKGSLNIESFKNTS